ncbi:phage tail terminator protein [Caldimonas sp. KR1-144]|uniref:phage tail terminator protein n=1 Tax=Caldimonas sp. KR1-144 TaxID=3400911 RepID=UPI003BFED45A
MQNFEPFDTDLVMERLKAEVPEFRLVEGAAEYASISQLRDFQPPCAYVLLANESGGNGGARGARAAGASAEFGVVLAVRNYREQRGAQLRGELRTLLGKVRAALIGWVPPSPGATACAWRGGAVMDYDNATLLWVEAYESAHVLMR